MNRNQTAFVEAAEKIFGAGAVLTRDGIEHVCEEADLAYPYWFVTKSEYRHDRGQYKLPTIGSKVKTVKVEEPVVAKATDVQKSDTAKKSADNTAPLCYNCGNQTQRAGSCYVCSSCGSTTGCS